MALIVVGHYDSIWDAHVDRALLESEGLNPFLIDEHRVGVNWYEAIAFGGIKLVVPISQRDSAAAIFRSKDFGEFEAALENELGLEVRQCVMCGAAAFTSKPGAADRAVQVLNYTLLGFFHPPHRVQLYCRTCGAVQVEQTKMLAADDASRNIPAD
jgi:hypothetical protein